MTAKKTTQAAQAAQAAQAPKKNPLLASQAKRLAQAAQAPKVEAAQNVPLHKTPEVAALVEKFKAVLINHKSTKEENGGKSAIDIANGKTVMGLTAHAIAGAVKLGMVPQLEKLIHVDCNIKAVGRLLQNLSMVYSGQFTHIDRAGVAVTLALHELPEGMTLTNDAIKILCSDRKGDAETRGLSKMKLQRLVVGLVGSSSIDSMTSRTIGKNGFLTLLGITETKGKTNVMTEKGKNHPFVQAVVNHFNGASDSLIESVIEG